MEGVGYTGGSGLLLLPEVESLYRPKFNTVNTCKSHCNAAENMPVLGTIIRFKHMDLHVHMYAPNRIPTWLDAVKNSGKLFLPSVPEEILLYVLINNCVVRVLL